MNSQFSRMRNRSRLRLVGAVPPGTSTRTSAERQGGANPFDLSNEPIVRGPAPHPDLAERVRQIGHIDNEYAEEFILPKLGQFLRAGMPLDAIAQKFGVTVRTISNWKKRWRERLREGGPAARRGGLVRGDHELL